MLAGIIALAVVCLALIVLLARERQTSSSERHALLQMRVTSPQMQFDIADPEWVPPEPDDFERVGGIFTEDE